MCPGGSSSKNNLSTASDISPSQSHYSSTDHNERGAAAFDSDSPVLASRLWMAELVHLIHNQPWLLPLHRTSCSLCLAHKRMNLNELGFPFRVIEAIQSARAPSMRLLDNGKWRVLGKWCGTRDIILFQCSTAEMLCFLQDFHP